MNPKVSIVITNALGTEHVKKCLESVLKINYANYEVIVVDCLTPNINEELKYFSNIKVISLDYDIGPAAEHNLGFKYCNNNSEYIAFLDNDTIVDTDWLKNLIDLMETDPKIGIAGCKIRDMEHKDTIQCARPICDIYGFTYNEGVGLLDNEQFESISERFAVSACAMMCRREILETLEGFDSNFFIFVDDIDICWRTQLIGFKVVENQHAVVYHKGGGTKKGGYLRENRISTSGRRIYFRERNTLRMLLKNYESKTLVKILPSYLAISTAEILAILVFTGKVGLIKNYISAIIWNIKNINDLYIERIKINKLRKVKDNVLLEKLVHHSLKIKIFKDFGMPNIKN